MAAKYVSIEDSEHSSVSYDAMVERFMFIISVRQPHLANELEKVFEPYKTTTEMFRYLWHLSEAHSALTPVLSPSKKSITTANLYYSHGNACMNNHDRDYALKFYNFSLLYSHHPIVPVEGKQWGTEERHAVDRVDARAYREGWGVYSSLAKAYQGRASVLFTLEQYEKCKADIDRVLALGCPPSINRKMMSMRAECVRHGADVRQAPARRRDNSMAFIFHSPEAPILESTNPSFPSISSAVSLAYSAELGRHLVANRDIGPGEIVAVDKGHCVAVLPKYAKAYCTMCLKRAPAPLPCPNCSMVIFCSEECRMKGLTGVHWYECPILYTLCLLNMGTNPTIAYRLFAQNGYLNLRGMVPGLVLETERMPPKSRGINADGVYDSSHYRTVFHLETNKEKRSSKDAMTRAIESFVVLKLLCMSGRFFVDDAGVPFQPLEEELIFTGSHLIHTMMSLWCNADTIGELQITGQQCLSPLLPYAAGVFPSTCLLNHACYSSCAPVSYGDTQVMKACRRLPAGTVLTRQYIDLFKKDLEQRERALSRYYFECKCESCANNWPQTLAHTLDFELKCVVCHKLVHRQRKKCDACKITYNHDGPVENRPDVTAYDYDCMRKRVRDAIAVFQETEGRVIKALDRLEDMVIIHGIIDLYDKYVMLPTYVHVVAQSMYNSLQHKLGTQAHVKASIVTDCPIT